MATALTAERQRYLRLVSLLLIFQLAVVLTVVVVVSRWMPDAVCLATCNRWLDLALFILIIVPLVWAVQAPTTRPAWRFASMTAVAGIMGHILALQYNLISATRNGKRAAADLARAVAVVVALFCLNLLLLPLTMRHMGVVSTLSVSFFVGLIALLAWGLMVGRAHLMWVAVGVFVFVGLLTTDLTLLTAGCRKAGTEGCDPVRGASLLFSDLINLVQQFFVLMSHRE